MGEQVNTIWEQCLEYIKTRVASQTFNTWFVPIKPISVDQENIYLKVPNEFFYDWIDAHYKQLIERALKEVTGNGLRVKYTVVFEEDKDVAEVKEGRKLKVNEIYEERIKTGFIEQGSKLNERYTFDNFVEGSSNQFAKAAAMAVAAAPGRTSFNPLVIYGGTGLGKTHLIQAIGNEAIASGRVKKVIYVSSDTFTLDFIAAIQKNRSTDFSHYYRKADMLLLDDIQFFQGKEQTQEQFFHIFNDLYQHKKQIVLTTDRPPLELKGLQERLLSRFQSGLTVDIQPPDLETRIAILQRKALDDGIEINFEVIEYLAANIKTNIRELEGAMIRLLAYSSLMQVDIDLPLAQKVVREILGTKPSRLASIENIQSLVANTFHINLDRLVGKGRTQEVAEARMIAMYLAREYTNQSLKNIGLYFGGRDHSTVVHACKWVEDRMGKDPKFAEQIRALERKIQPF